MAAMALVANDARLAARWFPGWGVADEPPAWVDWLERQPPDVRLAAFPLPRETPFDWWGRHTLEWLPMHGHTTLNGANFALLEGDLRLLGGTFQRINPAGLRLLVSLGYETLAFHRDYLAANPWIASLPWLDRLEERDGWLICRANARLARLPERSLDELLDRGPAPDGRKPREVPPNCWITGSWPVDEDVMVAGSEGALMAWTDDRGRPLAPPRPSLYQHVFGPSVAAYSARTPSRPGDYRLVFFDRAAPAPGHAGLPGRAGPRRRPADRPVRAPDVTVHPITLGPGSADRSGPLALTLENRSSRYLIAQVNREFLRTANQAHPGLRSRWERLDAGAMVLRIAPAVAVAGDADAGRELPLPADLPPGGRLQVTVPADRWPSSWKGQAIRVEPTFARVGHREAAPGSADVAIAADRPTAEIARPSAARRRRPRPLAGEADPCVASEGARPARGLAGSDGPGAGRCGPNWACRARPSPILPGATPPTIKRPRTIHCRPRPDGFVRADRVWSEMPRGFVRAESAAASGAVGSFAPNPRPAGGPWLRSSRFSMSDRPYRLPFWQGWVRLPRFSRPN